MKNVTSKRETCGALGEIMQLTQGKAFREFVLERVRQAQLEILIQAYQLEFDAFGQILISELEYACQRGLRVHCILDGYGCRTFIKEHASLMQKLEMEFRIHRPLTRPLPSRDKRQQPWPHPLTKLLLRLQRRDTINRLAFDRRIAICGNCGLSWMTSKETQTSKVIEGNLARQQAENIDAIWKISTAPNPGEG